MRKLCALALCVCLSLFLCAPALASDGNFELMRDFLTNEIILGQPTLEQEAENAPGFVTVAFWPDGVALLAAPDRVLYWADCDTAVLVKVFTSLCSTYPVMSGNGECQLVLMLFGDSEEASLVVRNAQEAAEAAAIFADIMQ